MMRAVRTYLNHCERNSIHGLASRDAEQIYQKYGRVCRVLLNTDHREKHHITAMSMTSIQPRECDFHFQGNKTDNLNSLSFQNDDEQVEYDVGDFEIDYVVFLLLMFVLVCIFSFMYLFEFVVYP